MALLGKQTNDAMGIGTQSRHANSSSIRPSHKKTNGTIVGVQLYLYPLLRTIVVLYQQLVLSGSMT